MQGELKQIFDDLTADVDTDHVDITHADIVVAWVDDKGEVNIFTCADFGQLIEWVMYGAIHNTSGKLH